MNLVVALWSFLLFFQTFSVTEGQVATSDGDLRLVGGANSGEGRVEVYLNGQWGTVCDDSWDDTDAQVVCRQLGFDSSSAVAFTNAHFGAGNETSDIWLDGVHCAGSESRLTDCPANDVGNHDCSHAEDAGVSCGSSTDIRLVGGSHAWEGRVEVYVNGQWGTVCDDGWDNNDAAVVCRQLGFNATGAVSHSDASFGQGSGSIYLYQVGCEGAESTIWQCSANHVGYHGCGHNEDAGVTCTESQASSPDGDLRLVGGSHLGEGRVEVYHNGQWGTVCDDFWDDTDAQVVCRQLGFDSSSAVAFTDAHFGAGNETSNIWLDGVHCTGSESRLTDCPANDVGNHDCSHDEDAGVSCGSSTDPDIRLVGGSHAWEGRVEVYVNGQWGTVCDDGWDNNDAAVVCRQLGFNATGAVSHADASFGQGSGSIYLYQVGCEGVESTIWQCPANPVGYHGCGHNEDAGVTCTETQASSPDGDLRLVGGSHLGEGRVEVYHNGQWGTVCDDFWDDTDAQVVCRQLGFDASSAVAFTDTHFGAGNETSDIWLDDVHCAGSESRLTDCPANDVGNHDCSHAEDAGVSCGSSTDTDIRLVGGSHAWEGRVEVNVNGQWGTVCDDGWDNNDAAVVCRQLGFNATGAVGHADASFGQGSGSIHLYQVGCEGVESTIWQCSANPVGYHGCDHNEDAGVTCADTDIRLVGGSHAWEGRVEVYVNGQWGTVCDDDWDNNDAAVVCRQLGFNATGAVGHLMASFGQGSGSIHLDEVGCEGAESTIWQCSANPVGDNDCAHSEDASVTCTEAAHDSQNTPSPPSTILPEPVQDQTLDINVRLVGSANSGEGRVEVYLNGQWGTVCDDFWDDTDAQVVCRQLGFNSSSAEAHRHAHFGEGTSPIWLDGVHCTGSESRLTDCPANDAGNHDCSHDEDAGVSCGSSTDIRLVGGSHAWEGRVEVYVNGQWGTVCDDGWDNNDAAVVCRQLGFNASGAINQQYAYFGEGSGDIHLDTVECVGTESNIWQCPANPVGQHDCVHSEDAGVTCAEAAHDSQNTPSPPSTILPQPVQDQTLDTNVRLVGGANSGEGRVEVYLNGQWGTVCDDSWDDTDAQVVCRQLGFNSSSAEAHRHAHFGEGTSPILLDGVHCTGSESRLTDCPANDAGNHDCSHDEDAGVSCGSSTDIRLVGGSHAWEGRVEVNVNGQWGTVCDDGWDNNDAAVVCRQLGFNASGAINHQYGYFGEGSGDIHLDTVECVGTESSIWQCPANPVGHHDCVHSEDAGVTCAGTGITVISTTHSYNIDDFGNDHSAYSVMYITLGIAVPIVIIALLVIAMKFSCRTAKTNTGSASRVSYVPYPVYHAQPQQRAVPVAMPVPVEMSIFQPAAGTPRHHPAAMANQPRGAYHAGARGFVVRHM